jgi:hypothetical protein
MFLGPSGESLIRVRTKTDRVIRNNAEDSGGRHQPASDFENAPCLIRVTALIGSHCAQDRHLPPYRCPGSTSHCLVPRPPLFRSLMEHTRRLSGHGLMSTHHQDFQTSWAPNSSSYLGRIALGWAMIIGCLASCSEEPPVVEEIIPAVRRESEHHVPGSGELAR